MKRIPLQVVPSQKLSIQLGGQPCQLVIRQRQTGLFCDVSVNNVLFVAGVLCHNLNLIVRSLYLGFLGDLMFIDTLGEEDPDYTGLGTRFDLIYIEASELP